MGRQQADGVSRLLADAGAVERPADLVQVAVLAPVQGRRQLEILLADAAHGAVAQLGRARHAHGCIAALWREFQRCRRNPCRRRRLDRDRGRLPAEGGTGGSGSQLADGRRRAPRRLRRVGGLGRLRWWCRGAGIHGGSLRLGAGGWRSGAGRRRHLGRWCGRDGGRHGICRRWRDQAGHEGARVLPGPGHPAELWQAQQQERMNRHHDQGRGHQLPRWCGGRGVGEQGGIQVGEGRLAAGRWPGVCGRPPAARRTGRSWRHRRWTRVWRRSGVGPPHGAPGGTPAPPLAA